MKQPIVKYNTGFVRLDSLMAAVATGVVLLSSFTMLGLLAVAGWYLWGRPV